MTDPSPRASASATRDPLVNQFSWSVSRDRTFHQCQRQYWYSYYGTWGGWEADADPAVRERWILKQVQSRHLWLGDLAHRGAAFALRFAHQQHRLPPEKEHLQWVDNEMREDFRASRDGEMRRTGAKSPLLFEHEHEEDVVPGEWKAMHRRLLAAMRSFRRTDPVERALAATPARWKSIETLDGFEVDGTRINVRLDFAYFEDDRLHIVDWKTGRRPPQPGPLQLACYALFAQEKWHVPVHKIRTTELNLEQNRAAEASATKEDLDETVKHIRRSTMAMKAKLDDVDANTAGEESFAKVEQLSVCKWCNFQTVCLGGLAKDVLGRSRRR